MKSEVDEKGCFGFLVPAKLASVSLNIVEMSLEFRRAPPARVLGSRPVSRNHVSTNERPISEKNSGFENFIRFRYFFHFTEQF